MDDRELCCNVCHGLYGEDRLPLQLGCGHSLCTFCTENLIAQDCRCPECHTVFKANAASDLAVNHQLLRIIKSVHKSLSSKPKGSCSQKPEAGVCENHASPYSKRCFSCRVWVCSECLALHHKAPPEGSCRIQSSSEAIKVIKEEQRKSIAEEIRKLQDFKSKTEEYISCINMTKSKMEDNIIRLRAMLLEEEEYFEDLENKRRESVVQHTNLQTHIESLQEINSQFTGAKALQEVISASKESSELLGKAERCIEEETLVQAQSLTVLHNRGLQNLKTTIMMTEHVYAAHIVRGRQRWSRVISQDNMVHLHALQDLQPPSTAVIVPFAALRDLVPAKCQPTVFLDVGWSGHQEGRVYIQLLRDSPQLHDFLLLCSGELGSTLQQTNVIEVLSESDEKKTMSGKVLLRNNFIFGPPDHGSLHRFKEGCLTAKLERNNFFNFFRTGMRCSFHFKLYIKGDHTGRDKKIGKITKGLHYLQQVVTENCTSGVSIKDCGLIVPNTK